MSPMELEMKRFNITLHLTLKQIVRLIHEHPDYEILETKDHSPRKPRANGEMTGRDLALHYIKQHRTFTYGELVKVFTQDKRSHKSASPVLSHLKAEGLVKREKDGTYSRAK